MNFTEDLISEILNGYGLKYTSAAYVRKVLRLGSDKGVKCLKRSPLDKESLLFIHNLQEYIHSKGFTNIPRFNLTRDSLPYCEVDGSLYQLTDWIESREADLTDINDITQAVRALARLHRAGIGFFPRRASVASRFLWGSWPTRFSARLSQMLEFGRIAESKRRKSVFDHLYLKHLDIHMEQGYKAMRMLMGSQYEALSDSGRRAGGICHHDLSRRNFLITPDDSLYLVDFDYAICDLRVHDIANLLIRNMKTTGWSLERARTILRLYSLESPVSEEEFRLLIAFMWWPQDFWQVGLQYYKEELGWAEERFFRSLIRKIRQNELRVRFLMRLPDLWGLI